MNESDNLSRKLYKNASWLFGGKTASSIFTTIQLIIIARFLELSEYGLLETVIAYVGILNLLLDFNVWETATKYIGSFWAEEQKDKVCSMIKLSYIIDISTGIVAFIIVILTAGIANKYFIKSDTALVFIYIYAFSLFVDTANSTSDAILRVFDKFKKIAYISSTQNFIRLVLVSSFLIYDWSIKGILLAYVLASIFGFFYRVITVHKILVENDLRQWYKARISLLRNYRKEILWFLVNTSFAATLKASADKYLGVLLLGYFSTKEAVALYKIAKSFTQVISRISNPLHEAIYPELVKIKSSNQITNLIDLIKRSTLTLVKISVPLVIVMILFPEQILNIVVGSKYTEASNVLRILLIAVLISQLTFWTAPTFLALDKPGLRTIIQLGSILVYLILMLLLVPQYAHIGAALALLGHAFTKSVISVSCLKNMMRKG